MSRGCITLQTLGIFHFAFPVCLPPPLYVLSDPVDSCMFPLAGGNDIHTYSHYITRRSGYGGAVAMGMGQMSICVVLVWAYQAVSTAPICSERSLAVVAVMSR